MMRIKYDEVNQRVVKQLAGISQQLQLDKKLRALVEMRVSQINGCAYCMDMHANEARAAGENQQRLDCLTAWEDCPFYSEKERAAMEWAEAVTKIAETHAPDEVFSKLKDHFSEQEIVDLTLVVTQMNVWNRLSISFRKLPESRGALV